MKSKSKSLNYAVLAILLTSLLLTGCETVLFGSKGSRLPSVNIYQPPVLVLPAGLPVQTETGVYQPTSREVWHSQARFRELELQVQDLAAALAQERARNK